MALSSLSWIILPSKGAPNPGPRHAFFNCTYPLELKLQHWQCYRKWQRKTKSIRATHWISQVSQIARQTNSYSFYFKNYDLIDYYRLTFPFLKRTLVSSPWSGTYAFVFIDYGPTYKQLKGKVRCVMCQKSTFGIVGENFETSLESTLWVFQEVKWKLNRYRTNPISFEFLLNIVKLELGTFCLIDDILYVIWQRRS